jgi:hypothetical protein
MTDKEIALQGVIGELCILDKSEILDFIENIFGEMSLDRLENILDYLKEESKI